MEYKELERRMYEFIGSILTVDTAQVVMEESKVLGDAVKQYGHTFSPSEQMRLAALQQCIVDTATANAMSVIERGLANLGIKF
jgi:hypothetical protein